MNTFHERLLKEINKTCKILAQFLAHNKHSQNDFIIVLKLYSYVYCQTNQTIPETSERKKELIASKL